MEEYRIIEGFENYSISNLGNIKNNKTDKILKPWNNNGYKRIDLFNQKGRKTILIHRLVAKAFIPNPHNKPYIDHIDNNKINNNVSNLRYALNSENNHNQKLNVNNTSGYKGVRLERNKYRAQIRVNNKNVHIGLFDNIEDAVIARYNKAKEIQKDFINICETNFNENPETERI